MSNEMMGFQVLLEKTPGDDLLREVFALVTYRARLAEARTMAVDSIESYLAGLREDNEPILSNDATSEPPRVQQVTVKGLG